MLANSYSNKAMRYQNVGRESHVAGASPHQLIDILFDELMLKLDQALRFYNAGELGRALEARTKALAILSGLQTSLDHEQGGELAAALMDIYIEAARRINQPPSEKLPEQINSSKAMIAEIASAWKAIG
ncbi:MAG: flagellar export chaperone FliS [Parasphingorhabdus sp.]|uniref:flagellar export chaperone FliS n=2 Tax=Parasphingorhabdus sp. TaxID=2709688 RepID=UPI003264723F